MSKRVVSAFMSVVLALGLCPGLAHASEGGLAAASVDGARGLVAAQSSDELNPEVLKMIEGWWHRAAGYAYCPADGMSYPDSSYIKDGYIYTFAGDWINGGFKYGSTRKIYAIDYGEGSYTDGKGWRIFTDPEKTNFYFLDEDSPDMMSSMWFPKGYSGTSSLVRYDESDFENAKTPNPPDIGHAVIEPIPDQDFTGEPVQPALSVSLYGEPLEAGQDYTVEYFESDRPGVATVVITGVDQYRGVLAANYFIKEPISAENLIISRDTWGFENLNSNVPEEFYWRIYGSDQGGRLYRQHETGPHGMCYGMAATAQAIGYAGFPALGSYDVAGAPANALAEVPVASLSAGERGNGLSAEDYIKYGWLAQLDDRLRAEDSRNRNQYQGLVDAVRRFEEQGGAPVCIAVRSGEYGHALWGASVDEQPDTTFIHVYDCNHPGDMDRSIELYKVDGEYVGWSYDLGWEVWPIAGDTKSSISWETPYDDLQVLLRQGGINTEGTAVPTSTTNANRCLVNTPADTQISFGSKDYELSADEASEGVHRIEPISYREGDVPVSGDDLYWVDATSRKFKVDSLSSNGSLGLAFPDASLDIAGPRGAQVEGRVFGRNHSTVTFDRVYGDDFSVAYYLEKDGDAVGLDKLTVEGVGDGDVTAKQSGDAIVVTGASELQVSNGVDTVKQTDLDPEKSYKVEVPDGQGAPKIGDASEEAPAKDDNTSTKDDNTSTKDDNTSTKDDNTSTKDDASTTTDRQAPKITVKTKTKTVKAKAVKKKAKSFNIGAKSSSGGKLTYKVTKSNKRITFKNGKATLKKRTKAGTYSIKVKVTTAAKGAYKADSKTFAIKFKVKK